VRIPQVAPLHPWQISTTFTLAGSYKLKIPERQRDCAFPRGWKNAFVLSGSFSTHANAFCTRVRAKLPHNRDKSPCHCYHTLQREQVRAARI